MSNRQLRRLSPEEIEGTISVRSDAIITAETFNSNLALRIQQASQIKDTYGYTALTKALEAETMEVPGDFVLLQVLNKLGIRPLCTKSVRQYQRVTAYNLLNRLMKAVGLPLLCVGAFGTLAEVIAMFSQSSFEYMVSTMPWWTIAPCMLGIGIFLVWLEHAFIPRKVWTRHELVPGKFPSELQKLKIPTQLFALMDGVRSEMPGVAFAIHTLQEDYGRKLPDFNPDPFLSASVNTEGYFIAVWDEPAFDASLKQID